MKIDKEVFIDLYTKHFTGDIPAFHKLLGADAGHKSTTYRRINKLKAEGLLPLEAGVSVEKGTVLTGISRYHKLEDGGVWVKSNVEKESQLEAIRKALAETITEYVRPVAVTVPPPENPLHTHNATLYISNDVHFGALMWKPESGTDWDLSIATQTLRTAYDYLFDTSPSSRVAIIADLGDLLEIDDFKAMTPKSGNLLATDGRYPKVLKAAYQSLFYAIDKALLKHEVVYFINIAGNHDVSTGHAIREIILNRYTNEPRVIVDESPSPIKYFKHGKTLLQFAHGDGMKMSSAGETMAADAGPIYPSIWFTEAPYRYCHMGHTHKDAVHDGRICRSESHRNLAPLNDWAFHAGFRRQAGTMKSITYSEFRGEISRSLYSLEIEDTQQPTGA